MKTGINSSFVWSVSADIGRINMLGYARNYPFGGFNPVEELSASGSSIGLDVGNLSSSTINLSSSSCELNLFPDAEYTGVMRNLNIQSEIDDAFLLQLRGGVYSVPCNNTVNHPALLLNFHSHGNLCQGWMFSSSVPNDEMVRSIYVDESAEGGVHNSTIQQNFAEFSRNAGYGIPGNSSNDHSFRYFYNRVITSEYLVYNHCEGAGYLNGGIGGGDVSGEYQQFLSTYSGLSPEARQYIYDGGLFVDDNGAVFFDITCPPI